MSTRRTSQTDDRGVGRPVRPAGLGQPRLLGQRGQAERCHVDAFGLQPDAEFHPEAVGIVRQRFQAVRKPRGIDLPPAKACFKVERPGD